MLRNLAWLVVLAVTLSCGRPSRTKKQDTSVAASAPSPSATTVRKREVIEPTALLALPIGAFHVTLWSDEQSVYLLTSQGAYRFVPDQSPRHFALDLGEGPVMTHSSFIYWSNGSIWRTPKLGGEPQKIASVPHRPQYFSTSGDYFVWLDRTDDGQCTIRFVDGNKQRVAYKASGEIDAMAMVHDWAFFVERIDKNKWHLGGIRPGGGQAAYSAPKTGRSPAMLSAKEDIYYYDVDTSDFMKMSPDLHNEEVVQKNFVCSPNALAARIYCVQVEGLFELPMKPPHTPRLLTPPGRSPTITAMTADSTRVVFVVDAGADKLAVYSLPLTPLE
jgi:hypothetical protein